MRELWYRVTGGHLRDRIKALEGALDGVWRELAEAEDVVAAVMYDYDQLKAVLAVREREIQCQAAQIVALQRMLNEARAAWKN